MKPSPTGNIVRYTLDPDRPEPLGAEQIAELNALKGRTIDFSDIPPQVDDGQWRPGGFAQLQNKQQVTLRIDKDVLDFFRSSGQRYQTRINHVLREYMNTHMPSKPER